MSEESAPKIKVKKPPMQAKTFTFTLSLPGLISAVGSGILALTFFFVMGILIGRGYRPEADVPRLGELMPSKEHGQLSEDQPEKPEILKAEELGYPDRLKASPDKIMEESLDEPLSKATPEKTAPRTETTPPVQAPAPVAVAPAETTPEPAAPAPAPADATGEPVYDYVYQVASFRKVEMADALAAQLKSAGLTAVVASGDVQGSTWHRVQVRHHGTPASTEAMKAALTKFGINKPLLKSKKQAQ